MRGMCARQAEFLAADEILSFEAGQPKQAAWPFRLSYDTYNVAYADVPIMLLEHGREAHHHDDAPLKYPSDRLPREAGQRGNLPDGVNLFFFHLECLRCLAFAAFSFNFMPCFRIVPACSRCHELNSLPPCVYSMRSRH